MTVLIATDLDRTLVYSRAALALSRDVLPPLTCVERRGNEQVSFMTAAAARLTAALAHRAVLVPVTTRLPEQLSRVRLPGPPSRFAVAANGGVLLVDGAADPAWQRRVAATAEQSVDLSDVLAYVRQHCAPAWTSQVREAAGLFCYAVLGRAGAPDGFVAEASRWAAERGWTVSLQGRKLYWMPHGLTKAAAVREVVDRVGAELVLAAGDSLLDRDLLCY
ncbi:MAG TPA: HAD family hydrolase, partial [Jatrophihabitans sp.]